MEPPIRGMHMAMHFLGNIYKKIIKPYFLRVCIANFADVAPQVCTATAQSHTYPC